jgi:hypothetical protein
MYLPVKNSPGVATVDNPDPVEHDEDHEGRGAAGNLVASLQYTNNSTLTL